MPKWWDYVAGAGGFEPPYGGIKIRCLTAWRRPKSRAVGRRSRGGRTIVGARHARNPAACGRSELAQRHFLDPVRDALGQNEARARPRRQDVLVQISQVRAGPDAERGLLRVLVG
jgi:hypothetical protein